MRIIAANYIKTHEVNLIKCHLIEGHSCSLFFQTKMSISSYSCFHILDQILA